LERAVEVENLYFRYLGEEEPALKDVSFSLDKGEALLILGATGSGKTTLVLTINGIIPNVIPGELRGSVRVFGMNPAEEGVARMARHVAYVFQDPEAQVVAFTVEDEVAFGPENLLVPPSEIASRVSEALSLVGLEEKLHSPVDVLSLGEKQKLALAAALSMSPRLLVLDEPTSHLDPHSAKELYSYLAELKRRGVTLVIVEHRVDYVYDIVDKVLFLDRGSVRFFCDREDAFSPASLRALMDSGVWVPERLLVKRGLGMGRSVLAKRAPRRTKQGDLSVILREVRFGYKTGGFSLQGISLSARRGEVTCIVGPNGSGKTTLLKLVAGILKPDRGEILVNGGAPSLSKVAFIMQNPEYQFVARRVIDDVAASLAFKGLSREGAVREAYRMLKENGLEALSQRSPFKLSQGQKRLVSILSILALDRDIVLMDEPTFGLDRRYSLEVVKFVRAMRKEGRTVLLVTHDTWLVPLICDKLVALSKGTVLFKGPLEEFLTREKVLEEARFDLPPGLEELLSEVGDARQALNEYKEVMLACEPVLRGRDSPA